MITAPAPHSVARSRARFSRSASPSRWGEYRRLLQHAQAEGFEIRSLEAWLDNDRGERVLILRHDVDQCPPAALRMLAIERDLGLKATWYLRWRTSRPRLVAAIRDAGGELGLHYETLSRMVLAERAAGRETDPAELVGAAQLALRRELIAFSVLFGPVRSACAHGDTRVPGVNNAVLLREADMSEYQLEFDANASMQTHDLAVWLTDRSRAEGGWRDGLDATEIISSHASPVLLLTHPNNWVSGGGLWLDRISARVLSTPGPASQALRTSSDDPPVLAP